MEKVKFWIIAIGLLLINNAFAQRQVIGSKYMPNYGSNEIVRIELLETENLKGQNFIMRSKYKNSSSNYTVGKLNQYFIDLNFTGSWNNERDIELLIGSTDQLKSYRGSDELPSSIQQYTCNIAGDSYLEFKNNQLSHIPPPEENWSLNYLTGNGSKNGIVELNNQTHKIADYGYNYKYNSLNDLSNIKFVHGKGQKRNVAKLFYSVAPLRYSTQAQFKTSFGFQQAHALPKVQDTYAQGSGGQWNGPSTNEIYSWGPNLSSLKYDGIPTPYDQNGSLISSGVGKTAQPYDNNSFFRTTLIANNQLELSFPVFRTALGIISVNQNKQDSPVPNSSVQDYILKAKINHLTFKKRVEFQFGTSYNYMNGKLMNNAANLTSIVAGLLNTPPSFDLSNNLNRKEALNSAWKLPNGQMRTFSNTIDHPYALAAESYDNNINKQLLNTLELKLLNVNDLNIDLRSSFLKIWNNETNGTPSGFAAYPEGRLQNRKMNSNLFTLDIESNYRLSNGLSLLANYLFQKEGIEIDRLDAFGANNEQEYSVQHQTKRRAHKWTYGVNYDWKNIFNINLNNGHYISNTARNYLNLFPNLSTRTSLNGLFQFYGKYILNFNSSISRNLNESSLIHNNSGVLSTTYKAEDFTKFYNYAEIYPNKDVQAEIINSADLGLDIHTRNETKWNFSAHYLYSNNNNFIAPILDNGQFSLKNVAEVQNSGFEFMVSRHINTGPLIWFVRLKWSNHKPKVKKVFEKNEIIPLAGFKNIFTALAPNSNLGTLYGTRFLRNDAGEQIINDQGFPMVDEGIHALGDPNPKWSSSLFSQINYRKWRLSYLIDFKYGGKVWNGTQAAMDYQGTSLESAKNRMVKNYLFQGVKTTGGINDKTVDFYDPNKPINENRWVRYGRTGVGEEYIDDATYLRLSNIELNYEIVTKKLVKKIQFGLTLNNLFVYSPNTTADPSSLLFNNKIGQGINWFNLPNTRSFICSINFIFN